MPSELFLGPGLVARRVIVAQDEVAWVRYVLEGHDGLASLHGSGEGDVTLVTTDERAAELDAVIAELGLLIEP